MELLRHLVLVTLFCSYKVISSDGFDFIKSTFSSILGRVSVIARKLFIELGMDKVNFPTKQEVLGINPKDMFMNTYNNFLSYSVSQILRQNSNQFNRPDGPMTVPQMAEKYGMRMESHVVRTRDGYILTLHQLILPSNIKSVSHSVLLHHGILGSSMDWFIREPGKSLPAILYAAGYDVWIANARGNIYSREHISVSSSSEQYWLFTWQEIGKFDLPATIDYIYSVKKNNSTISFVGHSMGATAILVTLSSMPHYNKLLRIGILLAPLAFLGDTKGPLKDLALVASHPSSNLLTVLGPREIFPSRVVPSYVVSKYYDKPDIFNENPVLFACGNLTQKSHLDDRFVYRLMTYIPAGGSTRTVLHYAQLIGSGGFHAYNEPYAEFPLRLITLPIVIFSSTKDQIATFSGVQRLYASIANPRSHTVFDEENLSHTEFVWGSNMDNLLYYNIVSLIDSDNDMNSFP